MITITNLTKTFGRVTAVGDVSFRVGRGEAVALWGPNGAGKTTIIRCLLGLLRYRGRIVVDGHDAGPAGKSARRAIGYVPQELSLYSDMRVREALHFFARIQRAPRSRPAAILDEVGLADDVRKRIGELSGGMKQRLSLAVALLSDPPILVLDELTSNLDRGAQAGFLAMLSKQKEKAKTILFASHRLDEIELLADRVVALEAGRLKLESRPHELAEAIGLRCVLKILVPQNAIDLAVASLEKHGYPVLRNGRSLSVEVSAGDKAGPIHALARSRIAVRDFEIAGERIIHPPGVASHE
ncbi:MAG: ABC transporter ATP-binding protein [Planctomycetota bacterium]